MEQNNVNITHFSVGNGNCSLIEDTDFVMIIDLNKTEDSDSSYDLLKPYFRKKDGKDCIDILCITHGDEDHCLDFKKFKEEIDADRLIVGSIWHQGFDRNVNEDKDDLPEDYLELRKEIERREDIDDPEFGDIVEQPKSEKTEDDLFEEVDKPDDFEVRILSPFDGDDENSDYDHNDLSIVMKLVFHNKTVLYAGDSSSKYWQDKIIPDLLDKTETEDYANAEVLVGSHHGSYTFFGDNRDDVREADPESDNYEALNRIGADDLIISAKDKFPASKDKSGDEPPHYAAYKWYHKWFRENKSVKEDDKHPKCFQYTSDGNIRLEYRNDEWKWVDGWNCENDDNSNNEARKAAALVGARLGVVKKPWSIG